MGAGQQGPIGQPGRDGKDGKNGINGTSSEPILIQNLIKNQEFINALANKQPRFATATAAIDDTTLKSSLVTKTMWCADGEICSMPQTYKDSNGNVKNVVGLQLSKDWKTHQDELGNLNVTTTDSRLNNTGLSVDRLRIKDVYFTPVENGDKKWIHVLENPTNSTTLTRGLAAKDLWAMDTLTVSNRNILAELDELKQRTQKLEAKTVNILENGGATKSFYITGKEGSGHIFNGDALSTLWDTTRILDKKTQNLNANGSGFNKWFGYIGDDGKWNSIGQMFPAPAPSVAPRVERVERIEDLNKNITVTPNLDGFKFQDYSNIGELKL